jgi:hypothetical protein
MTFRNFTPGPEGMNIEPTPNPKPLRVQRVAVSMDKSEVAAPTKTTSPYGFIRNTALDPAALTERW